tara:strand:- start:10667 stop:11071 length:405 start_codon:yes stop_codon:yes gene_type:complete
MKLNMTTGLESFVRSYLGTAVEDFGITQRDEGNDVYLDTDDLDPDALAKMTADATVFWNRNGPYILAREEFNNRGEWDIADRAAHDFYLTRNGHGEGFWSREELWGPYTERFTKDSEWFGTTDLTLGDDGKVYC